MYTIQKAYRTAINPSSANVDKMVAPANASKWQMGFNSAFKELNQN
jgi:hypothetical protein